MSDKPFEVVGVDLAARHPTTACCVISVNQNGVTATIELPKLGQVLGVKKKDATDENLLPIFKSADRIGIDAPFGWPTGLIRALSEHRLANHWPLHDPAVYPGDKGSDYAIDKGSEAGFRDIKYRATDFHVWNTVCEWKWNQKKTQKLLRPLKPISVAVDKLGSVAMRCASLLSRAESRHDLAEAQGLAVDRSGRTGRFVEIYPAAAFARWDIFTDGYKKKSSADDLKQFEEKEDGPSELLLRRDIVERMRTKAGLRLHTNDVSANHRPSPLDFFGTDHAVDALASALVALMAEVDRRRPNPKYPLIEPVPPACHAVAKMEGWIALPTQGSLCKLSERLEDLQKPPGCQ